MTTCRQQNGKDGFSGELRPADILLVHTNRSLWGWLIRRSTHCYWNHAMMVYSTDKDGKDNDDVLVIDAKTDGSIVLRKLSDYLSRPDKYDVAVKRMNDELIDGEGLFDVINNICKTAVNEIQTELAMKLLRLKNQITRQFTLIWRFLRRKIYKSYKQPKLSWDVRPFQVNAFTCGGFVQWCYYIGVSSMSQEKRNSLKHQSDVIFNSRIADRPTPFELLTTTPADIANCDKLSWVRVGKQGVEYAGMYR